MLIEHTLFLPIAKNVRTVNVKLCVELGKSSSEILKKLRAAYGEDIMKKFVMFEWHERLKQGREDVKVMEDLSVRKLIKARS